MRWFPLQNVCVKMGLGWKMYCLGRSAGMDPGRGPGSWGPHATGAVTTVRVFVPTPHDNASRRGGEKEGRLGVGGNTSASVSVSGSWFVVEGLPGVGGQAGKRDGYLCWIP